MNEPVIDIVSGQVYIVNGHRRVIESVRSDSPFGKYTITFKDAWPENPWRSVPDDSLWAYTRYQPVATSARYRVYTKDELIKAFDDYSDEHKREYFTRVHQVCTWEAVDD